MLFKTLPLAIYAFSRLAGAAAVAAIPLFEEDVEPDVFLSPGYLVPSNISIDDYDVDASFMVLAGNDSIDVHGVSVEVEAPREDLWDGDVELSTTAASPLLERQRPYTAFHLGRTSTVYGCGGNQASIRSFVGDAVFALCRNGDCDEGSTYTRKVRYMENHSSMRDAWLVATASGDYGGPHTRGHLQQAFRASVHTETVVYEQRRTCGVHTGICTNCWQPKFANYMALRRGEWNKGEYANVKMNIRLNNVNGACITATKAAGIVAGVVSGVAGGFFGFVEMFC